MDTRSCIGSAFRHYPYIGAGGVSRNARHQHNRCAGAWIGMGCRFHLDRSIQASSQINNTDKDVGANRDWNRTGRVFGGWAMYRYSHTSAFEQGTALPTKKLDATLDDRPVFSYVPPCGCTWVLFIATVSNLGYSPQTPVRGWKLQVALPNGKRLSSDVIPLPKGLVIHMEDLTPGQPSQIFKADEALVDRADTPIHPRPN